MTPSATLNGDTRYEIWYDKFANYSMLGTFYCATFSHQCDGKLEPRAMKCVIWGYPGEVKGYMYDRS